MCYFNLFVTVALEATIEHVYDLDTSWTIARLGRFPLGCIARVDRLWKLFHETNDCDTMQRNSKTMK